MQLRRFGLALERSQPRARLALDVERAVEVLLRALELQLRAAPALAVLAEPRRLLDQQAPIARLGGDDRSTRPCEMTEWVSLPRPVSDSTSITSVRRQRAPFSR